MTHAGRSCALPTLAGTLMTLATLACGSAMAQSQRAPEAPVQPEAALWSDLRPVQGVVGARGQIVRTWREEVGGTTFDRAVLEGDVRMVVGDVPLRAKRAVLWWRPTTTPQGRGIEIFAHLEEVGAPEAPASASGVRGKVVPVRAVVLDADGVELGADLFREGAPDSRDEASVALIERASASLARSLAKRRGDVVDEPVPPAPIFRPKSPPRPLPVKPEPVVRVVPEKPEQTGAETDRGTPATRTPREAQPPASRTAPSKPPTAAPRTPPSGERTTSPQVPVPPVPAQPSSGEQELAPPTSTSQPGPVATSAPAGKPATQLAPGVQGSPIFASGGTIALSPRDVRFVSGPDENAIIASGGVSLQYLSPNDGRVLQMTAQRAVIFLDPGEIQQSLSMGADSVRGIYLEGDVAASDGTSTLRAPRVFYDLRANKAVLLDAVFWVYDEQRALPLYVRAKEIRQESTTQWRADDAKFTTSALMDPELALGASAVTITRRDVETPRDEIDSDDPPQRTTSNYVEAEGITLRGMDVPVFWWPTYSGDPEQRLIRDIRLQNSSENGFSVLTSLDAKALLGINQPDLRADLLLDFYSGRGLGLGTRLRWNREGSRGGLLAYGLPSDDGSDLLPPGTKKEQDGDFRGILLGDQRWKLDEKWTMTADLAYISDETFVDSFFPDLGRTRTEFNNRLLARRLDENTVLSVETSGTFNDFIASQWLLQSRGYSVTKLPEVFYARQADDLLPETAPGLVSWTSEYRVGRYALALDEITASERGYTFDAISQRAFGIGPGESIGAKLRAGGYTEDPLYRLDTRQELSLQTEAGPVKIQPFAVGRFTGYDNNFEEFSPEEDDELRTWGAAGVRLSSTFQRVYDEAAAPILDIHRLRHIIEPNATLWAAGTNIDSSDLPIYDDGVESLVDGPMARFGLTQVFQTQRGGPGRWRSVDLLTLRTDIYVAAEEAERQSSIGRWIDFRPELSSPGDFFVADAALRMTDATSLTGAWVQDLEEGDTALTSVGLMIRQFPGFSTSVDLRRLGEQDSTYLLFGASYELTQTYGLAFGTDYDLENSELQNTAIEIRRRFATVMLGIGINRNEITGETSFGFSIQPFGARGSAGLSGIGGAGGTSDRLGM